MPPLRTTAPASLDVCDVYGVARRQALVFNFWSEDEVADRGWSRGETLMLYGLGMKQLCANRGPGLGLD